MPSSVRLYHIPAVAAGLRVAGAYVPPKISNHFHLILHYTATL